jgi:hypothetical protein
VTATNKDLGDQDYQDRGPKDPQQVANPDISYRDGLQGGRYQKYTCGDHHDKSHINLLGQWQTTSIGSSRSFLWPVRKDRSPTGLDDHTSGDLGGVSRSRAGEFLSQ